MNRPLHSLGLVKPCSFCHIINMLFMSCRHTEPSSGASTPDLDPYSPVDRKKALRGCTFVPDIQEIRVRSEHTTFLLYCSHLRNKHHLRKVVVKFY